MCYRSVCHGKYCLLFTLPVMVQDVDAPIMQYTTMPNNFVFIAFYFILPKRAYPAFSPAAKKSPDYSVSPVFLNSLLATLNARDKIRNYGTGTGGVVSIPLNSVISSGPSNRPDSSASRANVRI